MADIVERLRANQTLNVCPFDKLSPEYYATPNDKPCKFCGGEPEGPDKCTGADLRIMGEAADEITSLRTRISDQGRELAEARDALIWISDQNWAWKGGGSQVRYRGIYGRLAAKTLGVSDKLPLGWPDPEKSETRAALARTTPTQSTDSGEKPACGNNVENGP